MNVREVKGYECEGSENTHQFLGFFRDKLEGLFLSLLLNV
jgi:hypothetical protein